MGLALFLLFLKKIYLLFWFIYTFFRKNGSELQNRIYEPICLFQKLFFWHDSSFIPSMDERLQIANDPGQSNRCILLTKHRRQTFSNTA